MGETPFRKGTCPICGQEARSRCRCRLAESVCASGHKWHICSIHKVAVIGHDGNLGACSCQVIGRFGSLIIRQVDGLVVRKDIPEFTNIGNHFDFPSIPIDEIWIDREAHPDELPFFIQHALVEYRLRSKGVSHDKALEQADRAERAERTRVMGVRKSDTPIEHPKVRLFAKIGSIEIWLVDGKAIRDTLDVDFTEGGHWLVYGWIPEKEIWIDNDIQPRERIFVLIHELVEARLMVCGKAYAKAHLLASKVEWAQRQKKLSKRAGSMIKALSVKQPWANMIANGEKTIETRKWGTKYRGPLLIVSTAKPDIQPAGKALAIANLIDCRPMTKADESEAKCEIYPSAFAWKLSNIRKIDPFPVKGSLGIYEVELPDMIPPKLAGLFEPPPVFTEALQKFLVQHYAALVKNGEAPEDVRVAAAKFAKISDSHEVELDLSNWKYLEMLPPHMRGSETVGPLGDIVTPFPAIEIHIRTIPDQDVKYTGKWIRKNWVLDFIIPESWLVPTDMNSFVLYVRRVLMLARHEATHVAQTILDEIKLAGNGDIGEPSRKHKIPGSHYTGVVPVENIPMTGLSKDQLERIDEERVALPHHLRDIEFYPRLNEIVMLYTSKLADMPSQDRREGLKKMILDSPALNRLRTDNPSRWRETVRKIVSLIFADNVFKTSTIEYSEPLSKRAKDHAYVEKKKEESGNITYLYDKKHIAARNRKKEQRLKRLNSSLKKMRAKVKKDLSSDDERTRLSALAIALIDETYERIGNEESASELKHYGVTGWLLRHVTFGKGKATIKYVGKAGVKQSKEVKTKQVLNALKRACKDKKKSDRVLAGITAKDVNSYLAPFKVTAKDIRGFHANKEMLRSLKENGKGKLPKEGKERDKALKERFKKALADAAKKVGHEPGTLKNQYLIPRIEQYYMEGKSVRGILASLEPPISKRAEFIDDSDLEPHMTEEEEKAFEDYWDKLDKKIKEEQKDRPKRKRSQMTAEEIELLAEMDPNEREEFLEQFENDIPISRHAGRRLGVLDEFIWIWDANALKLVYRRNVHDGIEIPGVDHRSLIDELGIPSEAAKKAPRGFVTFYEDGKTEVTTYGTPFAKLLDTEPEAYNAVERRFDLMPGAYRQITLPMPRGSHKEMLGLHKSLEKNAGKLTVPDKMFEEVWNYVLPLYAAAVNVYLAPPPTHEQVQELREANEKAAGQIEKLRETLTQGVNAESLLPFFGLEFWRWRKFHIEKIPPFHITINRFHSGKIELKTVIGKKIIRISSADVPETQWLSDTLINHLNEMIEYIEDCQETLNGLPPAKNFYQELKEVSKIDMRNTIELPSRHIAQFLAPTGEYYIVRVELDPNAGELRACLKDVKPPTIVFRFGEDYIPIKSPMVYTAHKLELRDSIKHEITHLMQRFLAREKNLPEAKVGLPPISTRTPGNEWTKKHSLQESEFYANLVGDENQMRQVLLKTPMEKRWQVFNEMVGLRGMDVDELLYPMYVMYTDAPARWRLAVKILIKHLGNLLPTRKLGLDNSLSWDTRPPLSLRVQPAHMNSKILGAPPG